jgi:hypothetical protein
MWRFTAERFVNFDTGAVDFEALGREEYEFRKALFFRNFKNSPRAKKVFDEADEEYKKKVENGKQGGRPRKESTADGDTREDSQDRKSGTSANHYGDAATREGAEAVPDRESGALAPTTVSRNMRRVPQNEAPAHGFSGGRTAQGTMSRSPEAAAQSGKDYDQETDQVSTDEARESQRRAGADSVRGTPLHSAPARQPVRSGRKFRNKEEFIQWAIDTGLDPNDAGDCWEATMERGGLTKDGKKVDNICAYTVKWCRTSKKNRETA